MERKFITDATYAFKQAQQIYQGRCRSDNPPHIYAVADAAHQALMHQKVHQAIVISGESGAGKTESANLLLKQLVFLSKVMDCVLYIYVICLRKFLVREM